MLPPHSTRPTLRPAKRCGCFSSAASPAAPAPSTTVFSISSSITIACSMSPSSTSTRSSTRRRMISRVICPGWPTAMPSAIVLLPCGMRGALDGIDHRREARRLHADRSRCPGLSARAAVAMPLIRPPPPTATTRHVQVRLRAQHLEPDRALAGDHQRVVEGVHERQALLGADLQRVLARGVEALAVQHDLGAEAARALDLDGRRQQRHHDHRAQPQALRVVRHALRVVAGRRGDHALDRRAASASASQLVQRAALLERRR